MELIDKIIVFGIPAVLFIVIYIAGARHIHRRRKGGFLPFKDYDLP